MHFFLGNRKLVKADEESAATGLEGLAAAVDSGVSAEATKLALIKAGSSIVYSKSKSSPTIALSGSSTLESPINIYPPIDDGEVLFNNARFTYIGVPDGGLSTYSSSTIIGNLFSNASDSSTTGKWLPKVGFNHIGDEVEVRLRVLSSGDVTCRVWIGGEDLGHQVLSSSAGSTVYLNLSFGDFSQKEIVVSFSNATFRGVSLSSDNQVQSLPKQQKLKAAVISNSICAGYGYETNRYDSWCNELERLNINVYNASIGGSGFIAGDSTYKDRIDDIASLNPELLIIGDHYNDLGNDENDIKSAMLDCITYAKSSLPDATICIIGGWLTDEYLSDKQVVLDEYVVELAKSLSCECVMYSDLAKIQSETPEYESDVSVSPGQSYVYQGLVWDCFASHTTGDSINTSGFRPASLITSSTASGLLLSDSIHPKPSTSGIIGAAIINKI